MQDEGIDVRSVAVSHVVDIEEPSLEYIKITFMLHLSFEDALRYQETFYASHLETPCRNDFPQTRPFDQGEGRIVHELH